MIDEENREIESVVIKDGRHKNYEVGVCALCGCTGRKFGSDYLTAKRTTNVVPKQPPVIYPHQPRFEVEAEDWHCKRCMDAMGMSKPVARSDRYERINGEWWILGE